VIPIRDSNPSRITPYVTYAIIALNVAVFLYEIGIGLYSGRMNGELAAFFAEYGMVPQRYSSPELSEHFTWFQQALPFLSTMFLHGGLLHIIGNMWVLWIFGDNVEEWFGHVRFALFYLLWGVTATLLHLAANWGDTTPVIGASGAIAGVMGAYLILYPRAKVLTLVPIFIFIQFIELPAVVFLGFWFLLQFLQGTVGGATGVAWWAHIGGFIAGIASILILGGKRPSGPPEGSGTRPAYRPPPRRHAGRVEEFWR
jgi:membrane associated rhomboid family serine protease